MIDSDAKDTPYVGAFALGPHASAEQILAIPDDRPEDLFASQDRDDLKKVLVEFTRIWHPDRNKDPLAGKVTARVNTLYDAAIARLDAGLWVGKSMIWVKEQTSTKSYVMKYLRAHSFELGTLYTGRALLAWHVRKEFADLFLQGSKMRRTYVSYTSETIRKDMERSMPREKTKFRAKDDSLWLVLDKTPDVLLLRDVLDHYKGSVDSKHVAWIGNTLYNIACYFAHIGISHGGLSLNSCLISPEHHSGLVLDGWWYAHLIGSPYKVLPAYAADYAQKKFLAGEYLDLTLIRALLRELLGDRSGMTLRDRKVPEPMIRYLRGVSSGIAVEDYREWGRVLTESFGARRFVEMKLTQSDVYGS